MPTLAGGTGCREGPAAAEVILNVPVAACVEAVYEEGDFAAWGSGREKQSSERAGSLPPPAGIALTSASAGP